MILTTDNKRLQIFENGIKVNKALPKHKVIKEYLNSKKDNTAKDNFKEGPFDVNYEKSTTYLLKDNINFDEIALLGIDDLNNYFAEHNYQENLFGYGSYKYYNAIPSAVGYYGNHPHWNKLLTSVYNFFSKKKKQISEKINRFSSDGILQFFTDVKLTSKEGEEYVDRINKYLIAIHNATMTGQTALIEQLLKNIVFNKYDAELKSKGYLHVITEEQVVQFAKKCKKGVSLTYIENYVKNIPQEVIAKINELNELHIFDNYVILHYDPEEKAYNETEEQKAKRKDPILFGVCCGCNKLYYIDDWTDEYCDLTLDQFVDIIGTSKEELAKESFTKE